MSTRCAVVVFPGSTCGGDCAHALGGVLGFEVIAIRHDESVPDDASAIVLPGGFAWGDYLRPGALAARAPVMRSVIGHATRGTRVIGICNGFQILQEAGLLPGALARNAWRRFQCGAAFVRAERGADVFTRGALAHGDILRLPIANGFGRFEAPQSTIDELEANGQVAFRYCHVSGEIHDAANPGGSASSIAGITNRAGNVLGLMPHPERACEELLGGIDGLRILRALATDRVPHPVA